ncbi:Inosine/uridine-preferring nucleoside hydrolase domain-containing protein [Coniella lustricola]|uniref:Inosine/uridine-preferring nucleoside hydrolase domain-containing protein n=1 Tax=Coniella lustricola TaxID=2025994 RepID=A0A2T3ADM2_9PEZI|nr:Inosine/uridine-preferring nucleoside hydrolase domain-containing protein [Coniella lustricola]
MAPKNRIIIDTDPGVDDIIALLLALTARPDELDVAMISVTYGNVPLQSCLRNVVAMFHVLEKENAWRKEVGKPEGFPALKHSKPIVAVGAEHPLQDEILQADYFHGADGLHGVHEAHPDLSPADTWKSLFDQDGTSGTSELAEPPSYSSYFTPSKLPAHKEILRILKESPEDTVTIVAVGPLTNVAIAAAEDPEAFLRVKELVVMGGAVHLPGNITPTAEFNCYADTIAAARVYSLTSPKPSSTMPLATEGKTSLAPYPSKLSKQLTLSLFPLDITTLHVLGKQYFAAQIQPQIDAGSPLARWMGTFMFGAYNTIANIVDDHVNPGFDLNDPLCVWYMLTRDDPLWKAVPQPEDIRIETAGHWALGMHVIDRRNIKKPEATERGVIKTNPEDPMEAVEFDEGLGDHLSWMDPTKGNRINRIIGSPGEEYFSEVLMQRLFE